MVTPRASAFVTVSRMTTGSPAWNPHAMLADVTVASIASSLSRYRPKPSPMSAFRSTVRRPAEIESCAAFMKAKLRAKPGRRNFWHDFSRHLPALDANGPHRVLRGVDDRVVRLLHLWLACGDPGAPVLPAQQPHSQLPRNARDLRRWVRGAARRCSLLRPDRRSARKKEGVSHDPGRHGRLDLGDRTVAGLRNHRLPRSDHARRPASDSGTGTGRRVRRRRGLCRRARARGKAR